MQGKPIVLDPAAMEQFVANYPKVKALYQDKTIRDAVYDALDFAVEHFGEFTQFMAKEKSLA